MRKTIKIRLISLFLALVMCVGFFGVPLNATEAKIVFEYDNHTVEYTITDSWDNSQNISITIENTGDTLIENWMLSYDFFC